MDETGEETIVHASWNGATDVSSWRVLAGKGSGALAAQTVIPASGFESSTILPQKYTRAAVQALDSAGHVLGTSPTTAVIELCRLAPELRGGRDEDDARWAGEARISSAAVRAAQ